MLSAVKISVCVYVQHRITPNCKIWSKTAGVTGWLDIWHFLGSTAAALRFYRRGKGAAMQLWQGVFPSSIPNRRRYLGTMQRCLREKSEQILRKVSNTVGPMAGIITERSALQGEHLSCTAKDAVVLQVLPCCSGGSGLFGLSLTEGSLPTWAYKGAWAQHALAMHLSMGWLTRQCCV